MGKLTSHVLDTAQGCPAASLKIDLYELAPDGRKFCETYETNEDGRVDGPLLEGVAFKAQVFELDFHVGDYFRASGVTLGDPAFLDVVPVRFGVTNADQHYHVPLLVSPYGYSTYRGS